MDLIPDEKFVDKWLSRSKFKESMVNEMLMNQLDYFNNRRQIDKFHVWLFNCSRLVELSFQTVYLPLEFKLQYGEKIIKSPPLQTIQTWKHFLQEDIVNSPVTLELFICFLNHLRICDDLMPKMIIPQENECIQGTRDQIMNLSFDSLKNQQQLSLVLRLSHAWGNLVLLKNFYDNQKLTTNLVKHSWYDMGPIHDYYDSGVWKAIVNQCLSSSDDNLVQIIFQMMIQKLSFFTKTFYSESSDPEIRDLCKQNILIVVNCILTRIGKNPDLLNSLDLWKFSSFVPDEHNDQLTQIIVDRIGDCEEEEINLQLSSTIDKGCERSSFVLSMVESIVRKFIVNMDENLPLRKLYVYLEKHRFFQDPPEVLDSSASKKLIKLIHNVMDRDVNLSFSSPEQRTLSILNYLPLEHLQDEAQLKCSIFLISLAFSIGFDSDVTESTIKLVLPIFTSEQTLWFFKVFDPTHFLTKLITIVHQQKNVQPYLSEFISTIIERLFKESPSSEIIEILENVSDKVINCESLATTRCLTTLLLKRLTLVDCSETELAIKLISHLLGMLRNPSDLKDLNRIQINETLAVIMEFFSKRNKLTGKEEKLLRKLISNCSKLINETCKSLINMENSNDDNFKSNIKFLLFLCSSSSRTNDLLSDDQISLIWCSLFPNYPQFDSCDDRTISRENIETISSVIPIISKCVFGKTSADNLTEYVDYCFTILESNTSDDSKLFAVNVLKGLIVKEWTKPTAKDNRMYKFTDSILDKLLQTLTSIFKDQNLCQSINLNLIQACGNLIKDILHVGKELLNSPRLYYCLQICAYLPLRQLVNSPDKYTKILATNYSILFQFFVNYNYMVSTSMVVIKDLIGNYLTTLTQVCDQTSFTDYNAEIQKDLIIAATDLTKLISQLTNDFPTDFAPFSPHLISCYIILNHKYTIHPLIKKHLTLCMYRLLNVIKSNVNWKNIYDMIHCRLDESGRDLLKILLENYEKFYVFKGRF